MEKVTRDSLLRWVYENRYNQEISDEEYSAMIELQFCQLHGEVHKFRWVTNTMKTALREHWNAGEKLQAVKYLKEESKKIFEGLDGTGGAGLKEVKEYIDNLFENQFKGTATITI